MAKQTPRAPVEVLTPERDAIVLSGQWEPHEPRLRRVQRTASAYDPTRPLEASFDVVAHPRYRVYFYVECKPDIAPPSVALVDLDELEALRTALQALVQRAEQARAILAHSKSAEHRVVAEGLRQALLALFNPPAQPAPTR